MQHHNRSIHLIKYILSFFLVLAALIAAGQHRATAYAEGDRIYYFNMDSKGLQGSMILVETTVETSEGMEKHWGLLDAGHTSAKTIKDEKGNTYSTTVHGLSSQIKCRNGRDVANYMINVLGVTHLDFIVGTHAHSDHVGGIPEVARTYLVDDDTTYYYKEYQHISNKEDDLIKIGKNTSWHNQAFAWQAENAMQGAGAKLVDLSKLDEFSAQEKGLTFVQRGELGDEYGDSVEFTVGGITFRLYNLYEHTDTGNENVNSIVAVMSNGEYTVVNLADINTNHGAIDKVSQAIAEAYEKVDIVVAGHHGYAGSNTKEMFDQLQPDYVIVNNGSSQTSWFYTTGDLAAAIPYANERYGTDFYSTQISYYATVTDLSGNAVHIYSVNGTGNLSDAMDRVLRANAKKTGWVSWVNTDETLWSYLEKGRSVKDAWRQVKNKWYHFDEYGIMQTGWITTADGSEYFLNGSGAAVSGWRQKGDEWYYLNPGKKGFGKALTGWQTIKNKKYFFDDSGVMLHDTWQDDYYYLTHSGPAATGWLKFDDGRWYYMNPGTKARSYARYMVGWQTIGGKKYYFNDSGVMLHDTWQDEFYLTTGGWVATGWQTIEGKAYYLDPNTKNRTFGRKLYGWRKIGKNWYYLDSEDGHKVTAEWVDDCYVNGDGVRVVGWLKFDDGTWYYMNPNTKARGYARKMYGWQTIGGKKYYFNDSGVMLHDTWQDDFYLTTGGWVATGWQTIEGKTYYLDPNTKNKTFGRKLYGWRSIGGKWYYLDGEDGHKVTAEWIDDCYVNGDGVRVVGWLKFDDGTWYYMNPNTKARGYARKMYGWQIIGGKKYYFNDSGVMLHDTWQDEFYLTTGGWVATGWQTIEGKTYYLDPNTKNKTFGRKLYGWRSIGGKWYYLDGEDGHKVTAEWVDDCYVDGNGVMLTGLQSIREEKYYLNPNTKAKGYGRKLYGWQTIGSKKYYFDVDDGHMLHDIWQDGYYLGSDGARAYGLVQTSDGRYYYLDPNSKSKTYGRPLTGWRSINSKWYYFHDEGHMAAGEWIDGYYLTAEGPMATGLQTIGGVTYYMNAKGEKQTGWQTVNGKKYFFDENGHAVVNDWTDTGVYLTEDGSMAVGKQTINSVTYYFDANGHLQGGWHEGCYFDGSGVLVTNAWTDDGCYALGDGTKAVGKQSINGVTYYFDANGHLQGGWHEGYYFDSSGVMVINNWSDDGYYLTGDGTMASSGWLQIGGNWYYFHEDGSKAIGWLPLGSDTFYFTPDGVMVTGEQPIDGEIYFFDENGHLVVAPEENGSNEEIESGGEEGGSVPDSDGIEGEAA